MLIAPLLALFLRTTTYWPTTEESNFKLSEDTNMILKKEWKIIGTWKSSAKAQEFNETPFRPLKRILNPIKFSNLNIYQVFRKQFPERVFKTSDSQFIIFIINNISFILNFRHSEISFNSQFLAEISSYGWYNGPT